ncbi:MAG TPA: 50S ribosomal protein L30 [bacterium]|jgi:large subunit ribosomal protein L30|nr:50S ribosomal protein L30 [bacterium]HNY90789.1 50S ribosomal protein L30 [bacterium]HOH08492.1 50S ribosomal protein L30 [bacterium]HOY44859.1 50S ribosomal protein L30 [bacterium]HPG83351.1 50S ribosomal protein L30 [bacterium]
MNKKKKEAKQIKITLVRSTIGSIQKHKATAIALGLRHPNNSVVHYDTPIIRGMVDNIRHLVKVEEL